MRRRDRRFDLRRRLGVILEAAPHELMAILGLFLAYGLVSPMGLAHESGGRRGSQLLQDHPGGPVAHLQGDAAQISVEIGRGDMPSAAPPSFLELEETLSAIPPQPEAPPAGGASRLEM